MLLELKLVLLGLRVLHELLLLHNLLHTRHRRLLLKVPCAHWCCHTSSCRWLAHTIPTSLQLPVSLCLRLRCRLYLRWRRMLLMIVLTLSTHSMGNR